MNISKINSYIVEHPSMPANLHFCMVIKSNQLCPDFFQDTTPTNKL